MKKITTFLFVLIGIVSFFTISCDKESTKSAKQSELTPSYQEPQGIRRFDCTGTCNDNKNCYNTFVNTFSMCNCESDNCYVIEEIITLGPTNQGIWIVSDTTDNNEVTQLLNGRSDFTEEFISSLEDSIPNLEYDYLGVRFYYFDSDQGYLMEHTAIDENGVVYKEFYENRPGRTVKKYNCIGTCSQGQGECIETWNTDNFEIWCPCESNTCSLDVSTVTI